MKICVTHPGLGFGGSEAVAMALLETLQQAHDVVLITSFPLDEERLNAAYHTAVDISQITVELAKMPAWLRRSPSGDLFRRAMVARHARRRASQFDLCISACDFVPFSRPAVQFAADLLWDAEFRLAHTPKLPGIKGAITGAGPVRDIYYHVANTLAGASHTLNAHRDDLVVANSQWTADFLRKRHGINSRVIYPPVHCEPFVADAPRSGDFIILGRISPEKRIHEAIDVLARVRARGHDFRLNIIGPIHKSNYTRQIELISEQHGTWVRLLGARYGQQKYAELAKSSYALHMCTGEAFGIAVAEYMAMGVIAFVPLQGAPKEIVDDPRVCFNDATHAVDIIDEVLRDTALQQQIRESLATCAALFSKERFASNVRALMDDLTSPIVAQT